MLFLPAVAVVVLERESSPVCECVGYCGFQRVEGRSDAILGRCCSFFFFCVLDVLEERGEGKKAGFKGMLMFSFVVGCSRYFRLTIERDA